MERSTKRELEEASQGEQKNYGKLECQEENNVKSSFIARGFDTCTMGGGARGGEMG